MVEEDAANMFFGLLMGLFGGALVSVQNIFNSKVNERAGSWSTTTLVLGMGFAASFMIGLIFEGKQMFVLQNMQTWYWFSGIIGVGVVTCMVQGFKILGPTYAVSIALTSQLGFALLFDSLGWLGVDKVPFSINKLIGVLVIIGGILVFKLSEEREPENASAQ
jgi:transporter family-2 protein